MDSKKIYTAAFMAIPFPALAIKSDAPDFTVIQANDAYLKMLDVKKDQLIGRKLIEGLAGNPDHPETRNIDSLTISFKQIINTGEEHALNFEGYRTSADKPDRINKRHYKSRNAPLLNDKGEVEYIIRVIEEVSDESTEKWIAGSGNENGRHVKNNHKSNKFRELNIQLKKEVETLKRQLENANTELESFSYSVSHDLKTPLRIVNGYTNLLLEEYQGRLDEEGKQYLAIVNRQVSQMDMLLDDLLAFSRLSQKEITGKVFPMKILVNECVEKVMENSSGGSPEFVVKDLPNVAGSPELLRQVWLNLIGNAVKFRKENQKNQIVIGSKPDKKKDQIIYYIKDNGIGFNMKYADRLFGVFQRLHNDNEYEGSGVGLAKVRRIVSRYGGTVWVKSEVDKGSTFYFSMPDNHTAISE